MVRTLRALVALTCLALVFAGCTGNGGDGGTDPETNGPTDSGTEPDGRGKGGGTGLGTGSRPLWFPGLTWTYDVAFPQATASGTLRLFVAAEDGVSFRLTTDAAPELLTWALHYRLPVEATVDQASFSHTILGTDTDVFGFPVTANESWEGTDPWGAAMRYETAATTAVIHGDHEVPAFEVIGRNDANDHFRYVYTAEAAYVVDWAYDVGGDGQVDATMTLTDVVASGDHGSQDLLDVAHAVHYAGEGVASNADPAASVTVPGDKTEAHVVFTMTGDLGHYSGAFTEPDGRNHQYNWTNSEGGVKTHVVGDTFEAAAGSGGALGTLVFGEGTVVGDLYLVGRTPVTGS